MAVLFWSRSQRRLNGRPLRVMWPFVPMRRYGSENRKALSSGFEAGRSASLSTRRSDSPSPEDQIRQIRRDRRGAYAAGGGSEARRPDGPRHGGDAERAG